MGLESRSDASAHLQSQLVESLTEIPGTPVLLMVLGVQPSRIPARVHGARSQRRQRATCVSHAVVREPAARSIPAGRRQARASTTIFTPDRAELLALKDQLGIAADGEVY